MKILKYSVLYIALKLCKVKSKKTFERIFSGYVKILQRKYSKGYTHLTSRDLSQKVSVGWKNVMGHWDLTPNDTPK